MNGCKEVFAVKILTRPGQLPVVAAGPPKYALILKNRPIDGLFPMNDEQEAIRLEREADVAEGKTPEYDAAEYLELLRKRDGNA